MSEANEPGNEDCPNCGMATKRVITCARCGCEACVEFCIPGGGGSICAKCESEEE